MTLLTTTQLYHGTLAAISDARCHLPRSAAGPERLVPRHELVIVRRGAFVTHVGRRRLVSDAHHVLSVAGGTPVRFSHPTDEGDSYTALEFADEAARELVSRYQPRRDDTLDCPFPVTAVPQTASLLLEVHRLRAAFRAPLGAQLGVEVAALGVLDEVLRLDHAIQRRAPIARREETSRSLGDLVESVKLILARDPAASLSLSALAHAVASSPFRMARVFRSEVGVSIHQYQLRLRLAVALDRLAEGEDNLSALGHELGFASHSHFTRTFRRVFHQSPSAVRAALTHVRLRQWRARVWRGASTAGTAGAGRRADRRAP